MVSRSAQDAVTALVASIERLEPVEQPHSNALRRRWPDNGPGWISNWGRELGRDLANAARALERAEGLGSGPDGVVEIENALWRVAAAREKLHAVIALGLGVPALALKKNRKGIRRFEADRKKNRKRLKSIVPDHPVARELLRLDDQLSQHRFLALRHQLTHSLAPILTWRSLVLFEVALIENGHVLGYTGRHLGRPRKYRAQPRLNSSSLEPWSTERRRSSFSQTPQPDSQSCSGRRGGSSRHRFSGRSVRLVNCFLIDEWRARRAVTRTVSANGHALSSRAPTASPRDSSTANSRVRCPRGRRASLRRRSRYRHP